MEQDIRLLRLRPPGMFSNVNEVIEQIRLAGLGGYRFVIDWSESCYRDPDRPGDPWSYYFDPVFPGLTHDGIGDRPLHELARGPAVACTRANVITPRLTDGKCAPLLLPHNRHDAHAIIADHLHLRPDVAQLIEDFAADHFAAPTIGLHIRGPGRVHGGVTSMRRTAGQDNQVPLSVFFGQTDEALRLLPAARIFACSDSSLVIDAIRSRYGSRVITWPAIRSEFGEMHGQHPANRDRVFPPYRLGLDVLCEAWLLARTDLFVHGNSNVANFVISKSPDLIHAYVPA